LRRLGPARRARPDRALSTARAAIDLRRKLAELDRDAHLPELAALLSKYATMLAEDGWKADALTVSEEAVTLCRELAARDPDPHLPGLAMSVGNHALRLAESDQRSRAPIAANEAVTLCREARGWSAVVLQAGPDGRPAAHRVAADRDNGPLLLVGDADLIVHDRALLAFGE
jgi:hypothetical protein